VHRELIWGSLNFWPDFSSFDRSSFNERGTFSITIRICIGGTESQNFDNVLVLKLEFFLEKGEARGEMLERWEEAREAREDRKARAGGVGGGKGGKGCEGGGKKVSEGEARKGGRRREEEAAIPYSEDGPPLRRHPPAACLGA
jgi:hypothetical protein